MPPLPHSVNAASPIPPCPAALNPESGAHPSFEPFSNFREKMPVRPRNGTPSPRSSGHFWAQLAISAISAPNWQLFLAISTLNWHLLREIQKNGGQSALQHRKGPRRGRKAMGIRKDARSRGAEANIRKLRRKKYPVNSFPVGNISGLCWISVGKLRGRAASGAFFMPGARNRRADPWQEIRSQ